ncbi:MAG TPA: ABC transporter substrate-binding protein [Bacilli bacterium]|nr:ABC transporter substrate-binding protein [Bacilli bacterium]
MNKILKYLIGSFFLICSLGLLFQAPVKAYTEVTISSSENITVSTGVPFTTTISIGNAVDVSGFQFRFMYDETKFDIQSIAKGSMLPSSLVYNIDVDGLITLNYGDVSTLIQNNTELFHITFIPLPSVTVGEHSLLEIDETYLNQVSYIDSNYDVFAVDHINYNFANVKSGVYGDVNGDGQVTIMDVNLIQLYLAGRRTFTPTQLMLIDINGDGQITIMDVNLIQLYLAGRRASIDPNPSILTYQVNFITNGGSLISPIVINKDDLLEIPPTPTKDGFYFVGWYTDSGFDNVYDFSSPVSSNFTLFAKWNETSNDVISLALAKTMPNGYDIRIEGVVTRVLGNVVYIGDGTDAFLIYGVDFNVFGQIVEGDFIEVFGRKATYYYVPEIEEIYTLDVKSVDNPIPSTLIGTTLDADFFIENYSELVSYNQLYVEYLSIPNHYDSFNFTLTDGIRFVDVRVPVISPDYIEIKNLLSGVQVGDAVSIEHMIISMFTSPQLLWVNLEDLTLINETEPTELSVQINSSTGYVVPSFSTNQGDLYLQDLLFGYETVWNTRGGELLINETAVDDITSSTDQSNNKTYTISINQNLKWSNGDAITAKDYVFAILMNASYDRNALHQSTNKYDYLVGYEAYATPMGLTSEMIPFEGVKLIDDYTFSLTIGSHVLPNYFDIQYINVKPLPMSHITPVGTTIISDESGARLSMGAFDLLDDYINTYSVNPDVVSGQYILYSYGGYYTLKFNPYFIGNPEGFTSQFDLLYVHVSPIGSVERVADGTYDISDATGMYSYYSQSLETSNVKTEFYYRNGHFGLFTHPDFGPVSDVKVRTAIAFLMDRETLLDPIIGELNQVIDSTYNVHSWMYELMQEQLNDYLTHFSVDADMANALLDDSIWKYEYDGTTLFDPVQAQIQNSGSHLNFPYVRHNDQGEPLIIRIAVPSISYEDLLISQFDAYFGLAGVGFEVNYVSIFDMINQYTYPEYLGENRYYHMFLLSRLYGLPLDYATEYDVESPYGIDDQILGMLLDMYSQVTPGNRYDYALKWAQVVKRLNTLLPNIPIVSQPTFVFYADWLNDLNLTPYWNWADEIYYMSSNYAPRITFDTLTEDVIVYPISQEPSSAITLPTPERMEFTFDGWYDSEEFINKIELTTMPSYSMHLYAKWVFNYPVNTFFVGQGLLADSFLPYIQTNASDTEIMPLLHGYEPVVVTKDGRVVPNPTVLANADTFYEDMYYKERVVDQTTVQDRVFRLEINPNLYFSNGLSLKAIDYVYTLLLFASTDMESVGGWNSLANGFLGYDAYRPINEMTGEWITSADVYFEGIRFIDEYTFEVTLDSQWMYGFNDAQYLSFSPMSYIMYAPYGTNITSDENGSKINHMGLSNVWKFTSEDHYLRTPLSFSGPYTLAYVENNEIILRKNPNYRGNYLSEIPTFDAIVIRQGYSVDGTDDLVNGDIDYFGNARYINNLYDMTNLENITNASYYRSGYGMLAFNCDFGPTADPMVRRAISYMVDSTSIISSVLYGHGTSIYGDYEMDNWKYLSMEEELLANLEHIGYHNFDVANSYLDQTEWIYESDGITLYDPAKAVVINVNSYDQFNYFRHNSSGEVLQINHLATTNNEVSNNLDWNIKYASMHTGVKYTIDYMSFDSLLDHYYYSYELKPTLENPIDQRYYHIFNLAVSKSVGSEPYYSYHSDFYDTSYNAMGVKDSVDSPMIPLEEGELTIDELTTLLLHCEPGDEITYLNYWYQYQLRLQKILPMVPLYQNAYYDLYNEAFGDIDISTYWGWAKEIANIQPVN